MDYLRGFTPRQDIYAPEGPGTFYDRKDHEDIREQADRFVRSNHEAFNDLDIGGVLEKVFDAVPRQYERGRALDRKYLDGTFHNPVTDRDEIAERQAVISELQDDEELWVQVLAVKSKLDMCLYDERFISSVHGLKSLQDASNLVELVLSIRRMKEPVSRRLKRVKDLGARFDADEKFREAETFIRELYVNYELGDVIDDNMGCLHSISGVRSRREFYGGNRIILEVAERMLTEKPFIQFINDEARAVKLLKTMKSRLDIWHGEMFSFNLSGINLEMWGKNERKRYGDLMEYWLLLANEAVYSRIPKLEIGDVSQELSFYLGAAALQRKWKENDFTVSVPAILEKREIRAAIYGACNTSLIERFSVDRVIRNDIVSDRDHNLFVITGPNNGGKTTYIRQVGQMYWLVHLGMGLPTEKAELSAIDAIFTSFSTEDSTAEGTGSYLTELKKISQFSRPAVGQPCMTPYSIVLFDEFANGTDHEESVKRTKIVLEYLSQKGVTAYFITHKHEIADMVAAGDLRGAVNLGAEVKRNGNRIEMTYRIVRNAKENSYGHIQAEAMGITAEALRTHLTEEIARKAYPIEDTRIEPSEDTTLVDKKSVLL